MAIARANSNIALIKYWGKRDERLKLPLNSSISLTLDGMYTQTEVVFKAKLSQDQLFLNGQKATSAETLRVSSFMDLIRKTYGFSDYAEIQSDNSFPTAAGLASSASGFAALALAATQALALSLTPRELSLLARQGSGSACRSIWGGFVEWQRGERDDGQDSYALQLLPETDWPLLMVVLILEVGTKAISSTQAMRQTVDTSPLYGGWLTSVEHDLSMMEVAIQEKNFSKLGEIMEHNCFKMHATTWSAVPPIVFWQPETLHIIERVWQLRQSGLSCYLTIDAGPNVKILVQEAQAEALVAHFNQDPVVQQLIICRPGGGATLMA